MNNYQLRRGTELTGEVLTGIINWAEERAKRLQNNMDYYQGKNTPPETRPNQSAVAKVLVNHAKYITDTNTAYLLLNPVQYQTSEGVDIQPILDAYKAQTIDTLDSQLAKYASIYGLCYEYIYNDEEARPKSVRIDPRHAVLVVDTSVEHNPIYGVIYRAIYEQGKPEPVSYELTVVDDTTRKEYAMKSDSKDLVLIDEAPHAFGEVPLIQYNNSEFTQGDFEDVINLIDAYNILQSDRVNDRRTLVDAILVAYGVDLDAQQMEDLRSGRAITGVPTDARIEYLIKALNETDTEVLRLSLEKDIHKISYTPNMSDESFAGNASGVALGYKLFDFNNHIKEKEGFFESALMERLRLYYNHLNTNSKLTGVEKIEDITMEVDAVFNRSLPKNDLETSQMIGNLKSAGVVSNETLVGQLSFVKNPAEEVELAKNDLKDDVISTGFGTEPVIGDDEEEVTTEDEQGGEQPIKEE